MTSVINVPRSRTTHLLEDAPKRRAMLQTTLYDLIEAMQEVASPDEDGLVVRAIVGLFDTGRLTFLAAEAGTTRARSSEESGVYSPPHGPLSRLQDTGGKTPRRPRCDTPLDRTNMDHLADSIVG